MGKVENVKIDGLHKLFAENADIDGDMQVDTFVRVVRDLVEGKSAERMTHVIKSLDYDHTAGMGTFRVDITEEQAALIHNLADIKTDAGMRQYYIINELRFTITKK